MTPLEKLRQAKQEVDEYIAWLERALEALGAYRRVINAPTGNGGSPRERANEAK